MHIFQLICVEWKNDGTVLYIPAADLVENLLRASVVVFLEFDEDLQTGFGLCEDQIQNFFQSRDLRAAELFSFPGTEVESFQFLKSMVVNHSRAATAPFKSRIVRNDQFPVAGRMDVEFDCIHAEFDCFAKSLQCIFRIKRTASPVRHNMKCTRHKKSILLIVFCRGNHTGSSGGFQTEFWK